MAVESTSGIDQLKQLGLYQEPKKSGSTEELGQDQFLDLMMAQMKNQDPLEPMDNTEFISQLAQFSTARGVSELKDSFAAFSSSMHSNQALQASTLVGRSVSVPSQVGVLTDGGKLEGEIELPASATHTTLGIYDATGQRVRRIEMGPQASGSIPFSWDGTADDGSVLRAGTYEVRAEAVIDSKVTALNTNIYADVESVSLGRAGEGITLNVAGIGSVDFGKVTQIR